MEIAVHALSIVHSVESLEASLAFFGGTLALPVRTRGESWAVVDNGSIALRLEARGRSSQTLVLELSSPELVLAAAGLLLDPVVERLSEVEWVSATRQEVRLAARIHQVELVLARTYDEDELGIVPDLPTRLPWESDATTIVQGLLRDVPVVFRIGARRRITERAEYLSVLSGELDVSVSCAVQAVVQVTPAFQLDRLRRSLAALGLDPVAWAGDFEREP